MDLFGLLALMLLASGGRRSEPSWPAPAPAPKQPMTEAKKDDAGATEKPSPAPAPSGTTLVDVRGNQWSDPIGLNAANDAWARIAPSKAIAQLQAAHGVKKPDGLYGRKSAERLAKHLIRGEVPPWYVRTKGDKTPMPPAAPPIPAPEPVAASGDPDADGTV